MLMNTGKELIPSHHGLINTIAWGINGEITYALEGSVYMAGAAIKWLCEELHLLDSEDDSEYFATRVLNTGGVCVVPAFTGLGAPYWDPYARGSITGITRGTNKCHIIRATLEAIAFQTNDVLHAMELDSGIHLESLRVDGGACKNDFLMQFQSDIIAAPVKQPAHVETSALGAAYLAGLASGFWNSKDDIMGCCSVEHIFYPCMDEETREHEKSRWNQALTSTRKWEKDVSDSKEVTA